MGMSFGIGSLGALIGNPTAGTILNVGEEKFSRAQYFAATTLLLGSVIFLMARLSIAGECQNRSSPGRSIIEESRFWSGRLRNYYSIRQQ